MYQLQIIDVWNGVPVYQLQIIDVWNGAQVYQLQIIDVCHAVFAAYSCVWGSNPADFEP